MLFNTAGHSTDLASHLRKSYERASPFMGTKGDAEKGARCAVYAAEIARMLEVEK